MISENSFTTMNNTPSIIYPSLYTYMLADYSDETVYETPSNAVYMNKIYKREYSSYSAFLEALVRSFMSAYTKP